MTALVAHDWAVRERVSGVEFHVLALAASSGALLMTQANDLIVIFLGLEILSIGLYVLVAFDRHRSKSSEAALKYFLLGGFASAIFIYGAALVYGATGTTNLTSISYFLGSNVLLHPGLLYAGGALLLVGFAFKIAAVPFHLWSPDVYEGAPTPVTGLMASIVKVGAFAALLRVIISALGTQLDTWRPILWILIVLTTVVGASIALVQRNVKRMLAYSSINHAGFILLGVWAGTIRGTAATLFYVITYAPIVVATFAIVTLIGGVGDEHHAIERYQGLGETPAVAWWRVGDSPTQPTGSATHDRLLREVRRVGVGRGRRRRRTGVDCVDQRRESRPSSTCAGRWRSTPTSTSTPRAFPFRSRPASSSASVLR